jgi:hypothetical protein
MKIQRALLFTVLLALLAGSAQADMYYFTGAITDDYLYDQPALPAGTPISGIFTISIANAQTVTGTVGSANWLAQESGGTFDVPNAPATVFDMSFSAPGYSYYTNPSSQAQRSISSVGQTNGAFSASELTIPIRDFNEEDSSSVTLSGYPGGGVTGNGNVSMNSHAFRDSVDFTITSLTRAPEIDPASAAGGLTLLLSGLAMAMGARRSRSPERTAA